MIFLRNIANWFWEKSEKPFAATVGSRKDKTQMNAMNKITFQHYFIIVLFLFPRHLSASGHSVIFYILQKGMNHFPISSSDSQAFLASITKSVIELLF